LSHQTRCISSDMYAWLVRLASGIASVGCFSLVDCFSLVECLSLVDCFSLHSTGYDRTLWASMGPSTMSPMA
jgi:hypothetical protein